MLTFGVRNTRRNKSIQTPSFRGFVFQLAAEHQFRHVNVVVVVLQLVEDVEACIETSVIDVGVEATACVQGITEGIYVEVTLYLASHNVGCTVQRAWSLLLTITTLSGKLYSKQVTALLVFQDVVRRIAIEGITIHTAAIDELTWIGKN